MASTSGILEAAVRPSASAPGIGTELVIGGQLHAGDGEVITIVDPATEAEVYAFRGAGAAQVDAACAAARHAFDAGIWADPAERRVVLHRLAWLIEQNADELMELLQCEIGAPVSLKSNQVSVPVDFLRWFADQTNIAPPRDLGANAAGTARSTIAYGPTGVVAAISAYNYPLQIAITKIGAALATGCTVVLLPSPQAPLALLKLGALGREAGMPAGVLNVIAGGAAVGKALTSHRLVDKVSFTGSVAVGRAVMQQAAEGLSDVVLELGGKSAAIMLPGVDFDRYAYALHARYARHAGQGCGSPTRILVEAGRLDAFLEASRSVYPRIVVGDPKDPSTIVGPLISAAHRERVERTVREALGRGAEVAAGGGRPERPGWFVNPVLLSGVSNDDPIARNEIFGPVSVVITYSTVDEAVAIANDSDLGLKAYLYGLEDECRDIAPRLRVGTVVINGGGGLRPDGTMTGLKASGIGNEWGEEGMREFLVTQHIDCAVA